MNKNNKFIFIFLFIHTHIFVFFCFFYFLFFYFLFFYFFIVLGWAQLNPLAQPARPGHWPKPVAWLGEATRVL